MFHVLKLNVQVSIKLKGISRFSPISVICSPKKPLVVGWLCFGKQSGIPVSQLNLSGVCLAYFVSINRKSPNTMTLLFIPDQWQVASKCLGLFLADMCSSPKYPAPLWGNQHTHQESPVSPALSSAFQTHGATFDPLTLAKPPSPYFSLLSDKLKYSTTLSNSSLWPQV